MLQLQTKGDSSGVNHCGGGPPHPPQGTGITAILGAESDLHLSPRGTHPRKIS